LNCIVCGQFQRRRRQRFLRQFESEARDSGTPAAALERFFVANPVLFSSLPTTPTYRQAAGTVKTIAAREIREAGTISHLCLPLSEVHYAAGSPWFFRKDGFVSIATSIRTFRSSADEVEEAAAQ
jgi:hypothetical protein